MTNIPDHLLIEMLKSTDERKISRAINYLHKKLFSKIIAMLKVKSCKQEIAEEIFWDSMVVVENYAKKDKFLPDTILEAFIRRVCLNTWFRMIDRDKGLDTDFLTEHIENTLAGDIPAESLFPDDLRKTLEKLLEKLGGNCQKILFYKYFRGLTYKEIYELLDYASIDSVTVTAGNCMKRLRDLINRLGGKNLFD